MFQYLILSAFGLFSLSSNFIPDQLQVTPGFKFRYYTNNTIGRYANIGTKGLLGWL